MLWSGQLWTIKILINFINIYLYIKNSMQYTTGYMAKDGIAFFFD